MAGRLKSTCKKIFNKSGETLIECIIAIAVFAVVMAVVTSLVTTSANMLKASNAQYKIIQEAERGIEHMEYLSQTPDEISFIYESLQSSGSSTEPVNFYKEGEIPMFARNGD